MTPLRRILLTKMLALAFVGRAQADQWTFFHPEEVKSLNCSVQEVVEYPGNVSMWQAEAKATRPPELGNWVMTVGIRPFTLKGRHDAEHDCSRWMDEASKRVRKSQGR